MKLPILGALAGALLLCSAPVHAQPAELDPTVRIQLDSAVMLFRTGGFSQDGEVRAGTLGEGADEELSVALTGGRSYIIMGVCDERCSDLDLTLYDGAGRLVASDYQTDDVPMVAVEVPRDATYRVKVSMAACEGGACAYGVSVFAAGT